MADEQSSKGNPYHAKPDRREIGARISAPRDSVSPVKFVLTIAGHDLSNGAGLTKDLEVFSSLGLHGLSIPTSFVVQGPRGVRSVTPVPTEVFSEMLQTAGEDFSLSGVKIGVLPDAPHVEMVVEFLGGHKGIPVVLDPVMEAKNGLRLITEEGLKAVVERLLPLVTCLTPNLDEAGVLLGAKIDSVEAMEGAVRALSLMGPGNVLLKGGHLAGQPVDLLFDGQATYRHEKMRVDKIVHGTGCLFSSALLSFLVRGEPMRAAFLETERVMVRLLDESSQPTEDGYFYAFPTVGRHRSIRQTAERRA